MPALSQRFHTALVTGASSGLGRAFADMLLREGLYVVGTSRDTARLPAHARFTPLSLDLLDPGSLDAALRQLEKAHSGLDLVINNAGSGFFEAFSTCPPEALQRQLDLLLNCPVKLARRLYPSLERNRGALVNVSSLAADFPLPFMSAYNTAKAGLSGFSRSLMLEARACGSPVQILDFQPGDYHTGFNQALQAPREDAPPALRQAWMALERNLKAGPSPEHAARRLRSLLARGRSGQYASGGFFQARLAPLGARLLGWNRLAPCILRYHRIRPGEPPPEA